MMILIYSENKKKRDINVRVTRARVRRNVFRRLVEESIVCVYAQKDQARETRRKETRIFWTEFCLGFTLIP